MIHHSLKDPPFPQSSPESETGEPGKPGQMDEWFDENLCTLAILLVTFLGWWVHVTLLEVVGGGRLESPGKLESDFQFELGRT